MAPQPDPISTLVLQGLGLNVSGILLLSATTSVLGPLGWAGTTVAFAIKLIGDTQWIRAYRLWQAQQSDYTDSPTLPAPYASSANMAPPDTLETLEIDVSAVEP